jgi:hypothetical protein
MGPSGVRSKKTLKMSADLFVDFISHSFRLAQVRHVTGLGYLENMRVDWYGNTVIQ